MAPIMIRLYVTLLKTSEATLEYKKLIIMVDSDQRVSMLKRHIEREFTELFPNEKPFICSKVEDQYGYSLSNTSYIRDLLKHDDRVVAVPEVSGGGFVNSHDTKELVQLLATMQQSIAVKLANAAVEAHQPPEELLMTVLPLCFVTNRETVHSALATLCKCLTPVSYRIIEDRGNADVLSLLVLALQYWVFEIMDGDAIIQNGLIDLLEVLIRSGTFSKSFRTPMVMNRLMQLSRVLTSQGRAKLVKVINGLSRGDGTVEQGEATQYNREPSRPADSAGSQLSRVPAAREDFRPAREDFRPAREDSRAAREEVRQEGTRPRDFHRPAEVPRAVEQTRHPASFARMPNMQSDDIIVEYINMFSADSNPDMVNFGLTSIEPLTEDATDLAVTDKDLFLKVLNLTEFVVPQEVARVQMRILAQIIEKITCNSYSSPEVCGRFGQRRLHANLEGVPKTAGRYAGIAIHAAEEDPR
jgi:hypothetical protein